MMSFQEFIREFSERGSDKPEKSDGHTRTVETALEYAGNTAKYYGIKHLGPMKVTDGSDKKVTHIKYIGKPTKKAPHSTPTHYEIHSEKNKHGKWDHEVFLHRADGSKDSGYTQYNSKD